MADLRLRVGKISLNSMSSLVRAIKESAQPQLLAYANRLGQNGVRLITAEANSTYNTARPTSRRRSPGSLRLGSGAMFDYNAIPYRSGDAATQFLVKGGAREKAKFGALNFGSGGHKIGPVKGKGLAMPFPFEDGARVINTAKGAPKDGIHITGWGPPPKVHVDHPGTTGTHFFEKGIARARRITR